MRILIELHLCLTLIIATVNCKMMRQCQGISNEAYISGQNGCKSFIYCNGESSYEGSCPSGSAFNPLDGTCDDPANVDCRDEPLEPTPAPSKISCPSSEEILFLPNQESCEDYYMCYDGIAISLTCSGHLHFNAQEQSCDYPERANCKLPNSAFTTSRNTPPTSPTTTVTTSKASTKNASPTPSGVNKPTPPQAQPGSTRSPAISLPTTTATTISADSGPSSDVEELCKQHWVGTFPYADDCHYYYRCMNGLLNKQQCPSGYGWDAYKKMCSASGCSYLKK